MRTLIANSSRNLCAALRNVMNVVTPMTAFRCRLYHQIIVTPDCIAAFIDENIATLIIPENLQKRASVRSLEITVPLIVKRIEYNARAFTSAG